MTEPSRPSLTRAQLLLLAAWVAMVAPLVTLGYGSHSDDWLVYRAAHQTWETGSYVRSRSTGFPLYELLVTPFVHFGSWYLANALSLLGGGAFLLALFRLWNRGHLRHPLPFVLGTAFLPVFVKNAGSTTDFIPGVAVLAWSYVLLTEGRALGGAAVLGLAAGFRLSNGALVLPAAWMVRRRGGSFALVAGLAAVATAVGALAFSPVMVRYGLGNALARERLVESMPWLTRLVVAGYNGTQFYGLLGSILLVLLLGRALWRRPRTLTAEDRPFLAFHLLNVAVFVALYATLPYKPEYLFPILLSVAFLADRLLTRRWLIALTLVLLSYHVVQLDIRGGASGARRMRPALTAGFTLRDIEDRRFKLSVRKAAVESRLERPTVLLYGHHWIPDLEGRWEYQPTLGMWKLRDGNLYVSQAIREVGRLRDLRSRGFRVVVWKGALSDYVGGPGDARRPFVEVVERLEDLLGAPLAGKAASE
jgi:hypothetical protein